VEVKEKISSSLMRKLNQQFSNLKKEGFHKTKKKEKFTSTLLKRAKIYQIFKSVAPKTMT